MRHLLFGREERFTIAVLVKGRGRQRGREEDREGRRNVEIYSSCLRFVNAEKVDCLPFVHDIHTIPSPRTVDVNWENERYDLSFRLSTTDQHL